MTRQRGLLANVSGVAPPEYNRRKTRRYRDCLREPGMAS